MENWCIYHPLFIIDVAVEETRIPLVNAIKQDKCQTSSFMLVTNIILSSSPTRNNDCNLQ